jgi:signal transduction histidine kinase
MGEHSAVGGASRGEAALTPQDPYDTSASGLFERLHDRLGRNYVTVLLAGAAASIPMFTILAPVALGPLAGATIGTYLSGLWFLTPAWMALVGVAAEIVVARTIRPLRAWLAKEPSTQGASAAWHAAVTRLPRAVLLGGMVVVVGAVPATLFWTRNVAGLSEATSLLAIPFITVFVLTGAALHYLIWERATRPVVLEIAAWLPPTFRPEARSLSLSTRLLMLIPIMNVLAALLAASFATPDVDQTERVGVALLVAFGVTVVVAVPLTLMLRRSLLLPMGNLLEAMGRVTRGDLDAQLPVVTADELGTVAEHFNTMLVGLKERERLSGENERLQAQVRAHLDEVVASRARIIAASDAERRRVERNIHDGAQQRLVALALELRLLEHRAASSGSTELGDGLTKAGASLSEALRELKELARGLHPQILTTDGLRPALKQLAARAPIPVSVEAPAGRFLDPVESTVYFIVSEALANVAKYSKAKRADVHVEQRDGKLRLSVKDDGVGGADANAGSGLSGLADRVAALDGSLTVESPPGEGTLVSAELPVTDSRSEAQY